MLGAMDIFKYLPASKKLDPNFKEQLVIEYYSK